MITKFKDFIKKPVKSLPEMFLKFGKGSEPKEQPKEPPEQEMQLQFGKGSIKEDAFDHPFSGKNKHMVTGGTKREIAPLHKKLMDHYDFGNKLTFAQEMNGGPRKNASPKEREQYNHKSAIKEYTSGSEYLNRNLAKNHGVLKDKFWQGTHNDLSSALQKHKTPSDLTVYTGLGQKRSPENFIKGNKPATFKLPAYTSTTLNQRAAGDFAHVGVKSKYTHPLDKHKPQEGLLYNQHRDESTWTTRHVMRIHVPKGSAGAYLEKHTDNAGENEFLLHHGSKIQVHHEPTVHDFPNKEGGGDRMVMWHARMLHDGIRNVGKGL